jgi:RNase adaptor protein for sRNA GlmZ degradation
MFDTDRNQPIRVCAMDLRGIRPSRQWLLVHGYMTSRQNLPLEYTGSLIDVAGRRLTVLDGLSSIAMRVTRSRLRRHRLRSAIMSPTIAKNGGETS